MVEPSSRHWQKHNAGTYRYRCVLVYLEGRSAVLKSMLNHADLETVKIVQTDKAAAKVSPIVYTKIDLMIHMRI